MTTPPHHEAQAREADAEDDKSVGFAGTVDRPVPTFLRWPFRSAPAGYIGRTTPERVGGIRANWFELGGLIELRKMTT